MQSSPRTRVAPAMVIRGAVPRPDDFASVLLFTSEDGGITIDVSVGTVPVQPTVRGQMFAVDIVSGTAHSRIQPA